MSERGIEVRIYTSFLGDGLSERLPGGVNVEKIERFRIPLFSLYSSLALSKHLIDASSSWADLIVLHSGQGAADYAWQKYSLPCIPFFHVDNHDPSLFGKLRPIAPIYTYPLGVFERKCIRTIPLAFANSHSLGSRVRKCARGGRLVVVPLGVDIERFQPGGADEGFLLMAGRLHPTNNFELGLAAAFNTPFKIIIAGIHEKRFSRYYRYLLRIVETVPELINRVEFLSPSENDLTALFQGCSVFLSPRKYDYLGLAALEAMACGKPVIAYNAEEAKHPVIRCGDHVSKWREALGTLMDDKALRRNLGRESRQCVEHYHTWKKTVDTMLDSARTVM
jgi:glycosyltransferase involved in cell wall biosynthesis